MNSLTKRPSSALLLAGTLLIASASAAFAGREDGMSFRDFRQQNPDIDKHTARAAFREAFGNAGRDQIQTIGIDTANVNAQIQNAAQSTRTDTNHLNNRQLMREFSTRTRQLGENGQIVRLRSGLDLDLTSNKQNITLGRNLFNDGASVQIQIGDETKTFGAGSQVTAAEYIAVKQALGGGQKLVIDRSGRAIGGDVDLDAITGPQDAMRAANLVVANNVTTSGDFSKRSDFRLLGNLENFGTVLASSSGNVRSGSIHADDINNYVGGTIGSTVDLTLDAARNFNNAGTITSTGNLTINAGNAVTNYGSITANGVLGLTAGQVKNTGSFTSTNGNVNLNAIDSTLSVDNRGGTISASNGAINLRDASYAGAQNSVILGGDLLSKQFNMHAGEGVATVDVNKLTGVVSQTGRAAHLTANTELLQIGESCLTGDPTFFNTAGSILINGNINVGENLVIVAAGNITGSGVTLQAGDATNTGFDITLIAGAAFSNSSGSNRDVLPGDLSGAGAVSLTGKASKTGGAIQLNGASNIIATAITPGVNSNGGNVSIFAFDGNKPLGNLQPGVVDLASASITTGGSGAGTNGNVTIVGAQDRPIAAPFAVRTGTIDTTGGSTLSGTVSIAASKITVSEARTPVTYDENGVRGSAFLMPGNINSKAGVFLNSTIDAGAGFQVRSGADITVQNNVTAANLLDLFTTDGSIVGLGVLNSPTNISLAAGKNIGTTVDDITLTSPLLSVVAGGDRVELSLSGVATNTDLERIDAPKARVFVTGLGQTFSASGLIAAKNFEIRGTGFGAFNSDIVASSANFIAQDLTNATFANTTMDVDTLGLFANNSIGTFATPIQIGPKVEIVTAQALNGNVYLNATSQHRTIFLDTLATASIGITAADSILFVGGAPLTLAGGFSLTAGDGYLTMQQTIASTGAPVIISNTDLKGAKLSILAPISTTGNNNITISLGAPSANPMPPQDNVTLVGNVTLTGSGFKAQTGTTINGGAPSFVFINNGGNANSLILGDKQVGGVSITSND